MESRPPGPGTATSRSKWSRAEKPLPLSDAYAAAQPGRARLLQRVRRLSEQQQHPGDGRLRLSLHGPARESVGASRRQHDPDDDHPARRWRNASVRLGHHRPRADYADVRGLCSSAPPRPRCSRSPAAERRFCRPRTPIRAARRSSTARPSRSRTRIRASPPRSEPAFLTLDNGILEAGANDLTFNNSVTLTSNGGTFDSNGNTSDLERRHFGRRPTDQGRRRDPDPGQHEHLCRRHARRRRHARDRRERRPRHGRRHHAAAARPCSSRRAESRSRIRSC